MKVFNVKHDDVPGASVDLYIDRWQLRILGWHCATLYRHDMALPTGDRDHTTHWWLYLSPFDNTGIGIHLPVWLSKRLGLSRTYSKASE